jgi:hypothetical protein
MATTTKKILQIYILFDPDTYEIKKIFNPETNEIFKPDKLVDTGYNIFNWAKFIKPSPAEFGNLSSFLIQLKRKEPDGIIYKFSNNGNFLNEYLLGSNFSQKPEKIFNISYSDDNPTVLHKTIDMQTNNSFHTIKAIIRTRISNTINQESLNYTNTIVSQLRHELINPLNAIKLSGDQIRKHIRDKGMELSSDDIVKFNNIILSEVTNSIEIIDTITSIKSLPLEKISLTKFNLYIESYTNQICQTYFMYSPITIEWPIENTYTNFIMSHYVCINTNYLKIILDNIFKNIYGHVGEYNTNNSFQSSANKFVIQISNNEIQLNISNKIIHNLNMVNGNGNFNRLYGNKLIKSIKSIVEKYDLVDSVIPIISCKLDNKISSDKQSTKSNTTKNSGIGLTLINNLCQKMNIKWSLIDNLDEISFLLNIPVLTDTKQLGFFHNPFAYTPHQPVQRVL